MEIHKQTVFDNQAADLHDSPYDGYKYTPQEGEESGTGKSKVYVVGMSTHDVKAENDTIVYKNVGGKNNHIVMTERKFSEKSQEKLKVEIDDGDLNRLNYRTGDNPPIHLTLFFALQNILLALPWCLSMAIMVAEFACAADDHNFKAMLLSSTLVMSGLTTLAQVTIGIRLPVYQGPTTAYIIPLLALKELPEWSCPGINIGIQDHNMTMLNNFTQFNGTETMLEYRSRVILPRIRITMGCLALAGGIHMLTGLFGLVGFVMRFVGPITVIPTVLLIGLNAFKVTTKFCQVHWGIAAVDSDVHPTANINSIHIQIDYNIKKKKMYYKRRFDQFTHELLKTGVEPSAPEETGCSSLILSLYLNGKRMPIPVWTPKRKWHIVRYPLQQVLSILISILIGWTLSAILTETNVLPNDKSSPQYTARTDARTNVIAETPWFYLPYPGQFGKIDFSGGLFMAFFTATLYSITDSIADYHACAKMARVPPPPIHAINRGIMVEGCLSMISGFYGCGHATSTYGGHIGSIGITKVASRLVFTVFPCILILFGIIGKLAAVFITIPYPVLGGVQIIGFGMFIGLVMSNLQYIDINSTRNLAIIGVSTLLGLMLPYWANNNADSIDTGSEGFDKFVRVILSNPSLIGGFSACFLDNTVPGTKEERGLLAWGQMSEGSQDKPLSPDYEEGYEIYEIASWSEKLKQFPSTKYVPFFPNYDMNSINCTCKKKNKYEP